MKINYCKKYKWLCLCVLAILIALTIIFYQNKKNIAEFTDLYTQFDTIYSEFRSKTLVANIEGNPDLDILTSSYSQIADSLNESMSNSKRLELAQNAIESNAKLSGYLEETDPLELRADELLLELNTKASTINDNKIREEAIKISDLSKNDLNDLVAFKNALRGKRKIIEDTLELIINDNGGLSGFLTYLQSDKNQEVIKTGNIDLDKFQKKVVTNTTNSRSTAYARFQGLTKRKNILFR